MLSFLKKLFKGAPAVDLKALVQSGAVIVDVRSPQEYRSGHIKGSVNIPLPELGQRYQQLRQDKPIITCCASGMRSASARALLKGKGYTSVYNGGGWAGLQQRLK